MEHMVGAKPMKERQKAEPGEQHFSKQVQAGTRREIDQFHWLGRESIAKEINIKVLWAVDA